MDNTEIISFMKDVREELRLLEERLRAIEKEQRRIREDLLSGDVKERMQKRMLEKHPGKIKDLKKKIDEDIKIKI